MELSKEQIQKIEQYLNKKEVLYVDLRAEILDHIISDIESIIKNTETTFQTAALTVFKKWNYHLESSSSFLFGLGYSAPKMVLKKAKIIYKKYYLLLLFLCFSPMIVFSNLSFSFAKTAVNRINLSLLALNFICSLVFITILLLKSKTKIKTTYRFILKTQSLNLSIGVIIAFNATFINLNGSLNGSNLSLLIIYIYTSFMYFIFYKKHTKTLEKYKIS